MVCAAGPADDAETWDHDMKELFEAIEREQARRGNL
jgi:hypothetical protein